MSYILFGLAERQQWSTIDGIFRDKPPTEDTVMWACDEGLYSDNPSLRRLASTAIAETEMPESSFEELRPQLGQMVREDPSRHVRVCSAYALLMHSPLEFAGDVELTFMENFEDEDRDLAERAQRYYDVLKL